MQHLSDALFEACCRVTPPGLFESGKSHVEREVGRFRQILRSLFVWRVKWKNAKIGKEKVNNRYVLE